MPALCACEDMQVWGETHINEHVHPFAYTYIYTASLSRYCRIVAAKPPLRTGNARACACECIKIWGVSVNPFVYIDAYIHTYVYVYIYVFAIEILSHR